MECHGEIVQFSQSPRPFFPSGLSRPHFPRHYGSGRRARWYSRRDVVRHSGSIVVLAVDDQKSEPLILLEHQYRHAAQSMMWELPAGRIDEGESPLAAARRELLEETGYTARRWKKILHFHVSPGFLDETMTIYLARGLEAGKAQPEADEKIATRFVPLSGARKMALTGRIRDAKTISGILWLSQMEN